MIPWLAGWKAEVTFTVPPGRYREPIRLPSPPTWVTVVLDGTTFCLQDRDSAVVVPAPANMTVTVKGGLLLPDSAAQCQVSP